MNRIKILNKQTIRGLPLPMGSSLFLQKVARFQCEAGDRHHSN